MLQATSTDGWTFNRMAPAFAPPALPKNFADTSVSLAFDPATNAFVAFGREDGAPDQHPGQKCGTFPAPKNFNMKSVRAVLRAVSLPDAGGRPSVLNFTVPGGPLAFAFDQLDEQCLDVCLALFCTCFFFCCCFVAELFVPLLILL